MPCSSGPRGWMKFAGLVCGLNQDRLLCAACSICRLHTERMCQFLSMCCMCHASWMQCCMQCPTRLALCVGCVGCPDWDPDCRSMLESVLDQLPVLHAAPVPSHAPHALQASWWLHVSCTWPALEPAHAASGMEAWTSHEHCK